MRRSIQSNGTFILLLAGMLVGMMACRQRLAGDQPEARDTPTPVQAQPASNLELRGGKGLTRVEDLHISPGATATFKILGGVAYILIPDRRIMLVDAKGGEIPTTGSFLAFEVGADGKTIKVPEDYEVKPGGSEISYSMLCIEEGGKAYYAEGPQSPPKILIP